MFYKVLHRFYELSYEKYLQIFWGKNIRLQSNIVGCKTWTFVENQFQMVVAAVLSVEEGW